MNMKTLNEWVEELKSWDMPVLQRSVRELGKLAGRVEQITAGEIADVVLRDPLMTLKVLRLVNGMSRSRLSNEITTVEHAVMMLGVGPCFNRLANLKAVEESLKTFDGALPGLLQTLSRAHHAAWQARDWANSRADMKSEEVYIGALLYDMGEILLWAYAPEQALQIRKLARRNKISLAQAQKEILGFDVRELQLAIAEAWRLPELMQAFMHCGNTVQPRILGVTLAASVARLAETGWHDSALLATYEVIAEMLHMHLDEVVHIVHRNAVLEARHWDWYGVPPAAALLPMLPGDWPAEHSEMEETLLSEAKLTPHPDVLSQIMAEIAAHLDGTLDLHDMMALVLKGMHEGIGLNRVVFALMTADRSALKAKYVVGAEPGSPLRQFQIDMTTRHLFSRLMEKAQGIWLSASNRKTLEPMIPFGIRPLLGHGEFFAMSVFLHGKPVGLFYADSKHDGGALDEARYLEFKQLCLRAAQGLAHLAKKK
ncbi:MAG: HDOD domain-containing protein [Gammaproteobacteria bacterium]|nr:HDOD domain-containing protein [Gammaproteobacteria bacterium]MBU1980680.1 HDOD domain-containing protein [Gammaproteobacteria bacterium]